MHELRFHQRMQLGTADHLSAAAASKIEDGADTFCSIFLISDQGNDHEHDSYISSPYILFKLKRVQGPGQSMSYWTTQISLKNRDRRLRRSRVVLV